MQLQLGQQAAFVADSRRAARVARAAPRGLQACTRVVVNDRRCSVACQAAAEAAPAAAPFKGDLLNPTYYPTLADTDNSKKSWYIIDAKGQTLGRLATLAATYIRGKHAPTYSPSMDMGAFVVVINAEHVEVSGTKSQDKMYFAKHVNGRPGSYRLESFNDLQQRLPERIIERAVKGMLPKGRLGRDIRLHLKVYKGDQHPHEAQQPVNITDHISVKPKKSPAAQVLQALRAKAGKN